MSIKQGLTGLYLVVQAQAIFFAGQTLKDAIAYCSMRKLPYVIEMEV